MSNPGQAAQSVSDLEKKLIASERTLQEIAARSNRSARLTILVGGLLLVLMGSYFAFGYQQISSVLDPDTLISVAEGWIEEQLPEARTAAEAEVKKSAPVWAASLSRQAQSSLPTMRAKLEDYALQQIDATIDQTIDVTESQFRDFLKSRRSVLEAGFKDLSESPELAETSLAALEEALESQWQADMQAGSRDLFSTLQQMSAKLVRLKAGDGLTSEEQHERELLMLMRRLQLQEVKIDAADAEAADGG
jgi:hypothetical protein